MGFGELVTGFDTLFVMFGVILVLGLQLACWFPFHIFSMSSMAKFNIKVFLITQHK